jgi:glycosyltransferase involved in cell wall biosynthesis
MRLLFWVGSYEPESGGVAVVTRQLALSLAARGHQIHVVTQSALDDESTDRDREGTVLRLPFHQAIASRNPERVAALCARVISLLNEVRPDVIHVHAIHPSLFFLLHAARRVPCRIVFTIHGWTELDDGRDSIRRRLLRSSARVVGVSAHVTERAVLEEPDIRPRALTIVNGCAVPGAEPSALPFDPPVVLFAGRLVHQKGVDRLIAAMPVLLERVPALRLEIIGDGPERPTLRNIAADLGVGAFVSFAGAVDHEAVFHHLNRATVVVLPSRGSEGLPMAAIEAAMMGRPVVATRTPGVEEVVVDGETGILVESEGAGEPALAPALRRLIAEPRLAERLGLGARRRALETFGWDAHVARYADLYNDVLN